MILLTGANGQLGTDFQKIFQKEKIDFIATDYDTLDITNKESLEKFFKNKDIDIIINCAAYNNVDKAEEEPEACYKLNSEAPLLLAQTARQINAVFMTYSTDFVFDGMKGKPYTVDDEPRPLSVYGKSKREGELGVMKAFSKVFIVRTSWVFGTGNNNFVKQIVDWSQKKSVLKIVDDQISVPTYSYDLALYSWKLLLTKQYGVYHLSNAGIASKFDQAKYVLEKINWKGKLEPAKTQDFNLKAQRPAFSKLDSSLLEEKIKEKIPTWQSGINRFFEEWR